VLRLEVVAHAEAAARRAAELIAAAGRDAAAARRRFTLAVSGGQTPWRMLELLADEDLPWGATVIFQVDERVAPPGSDARNLTQLVAALSLEHQSAIRPMPVGDHDLETAATRYAEALPKRLDLVHLGLGPDGHTASLVPGDPVLEDADRRVGLTAGEYHGHRRMTLTYPALEAARQLLWLVAGADKRDALTRLLDGDRSIPAGRVEAAEALVIADQAAAGEGGIPSR
jgi:6-phosphogluconolactonase